MTPSPGLYFKNWEHTQVPAVIIFVHTLMVIPLIVSTALDNDRRNHIVPNDPLIGPTVAGMPIALEQEGGISKEDSYISKTYHYYRSSQPKRTADGKNIVDVLSPSYFNGRPRRYSEVRAATASLIVTPENIVGIQGETGHGSGGGEDPTFQDGTVDGNHQQQEEALGPAAGNGHKYRRRVKSSCPTLCRCFTLNNAFTADCQARGLMGIPDGLDFGTKTLNIHSNPGIEILPDKVFRERGATNIQVLGLSRCSIHFVGNEAFHGLRFLRVLDMSRNAITTVPSAALGDTPFLKTLVMSYNPVRRIQRSAFAHCSRLQVLELDRCGIKWIEKGAFEGLYQLQSLKIRSNLLHSLNPDIFRPLIQLVFLDASGNPWTCDCRMRAFKAWTMEQGNNKAFAMDSILEEKDAEFTELVTDGSLGISNKPQGKMERECCAHPRRLRNLSWAGIKLSDLVCGPLFLEESHSKNLASYEKDAFFPWIARVWSSSHKLNHTNSPTGPVTKFRHKSRFGAGPVEKIYYGQPYGGEQVTITPTDADANVLRATTCDDTRGISAIKTVTMECLATSHPVAKISWYFERQLILPTYSNRQKLDHVGSLKRDLVPRHTITQTMYTLKPLWNSVTTKYFPQPLSTPYRDDIGRDKGSDSSSHSYNYIFPSKIRHLAPDSLVGNKLNLSLNDLNAKQQPGTTSSYSKNRLDDKIFVWKADQQDTSSQGSADERDHKRTKAHSPSLVIDQLIATPLAYQVATRSILRIGCFDPEQDTGIYECVAKISPKTSEEAKQNWPRKWFFVSPEAEVLPVLQSQLRYIQTATDNNSQLESLNINHSSLPENRALLKALRNFKSSGGRYSSSMSRDYRGSGIAWTEARKSNADDKGQHENNRDITASLQDVNAAPTSTLYIVAIVGVSCIILFFVVFLVCCLKFQKKYHDHQNKNGLEKGPGDTKKKVRTKIKKGLKNKQENGNLKKRAEGDEMENSMTSNHNGGFLEETSQLECKNMNGNGHLKVTSPPNGNLQQTSSDLDKFLVGLTSNSLTGPEDKNGSTKSSHTLSKIFRKNGGNGLKMNDENSESGPTELQRSRSVVGHLCKISSSPLVGIECKEEDTSHSPDLININSSPLIIGDSCRLGNDSSCTNDFLSKNQYQMATDRSLCYQPVDVYYHNTNSNSLRTVKHFLDPDPGGIVYTQILGRQIVDQKGPNIQKGLNVNDDKNASGKCFYHQGKASGLLTANETGIKNISSSSFATTSMTTLEPDTNAYSSISDFHHHLIQPLDLRELRSGVDRGSIFDLASPPLHADTMSNPINYHGPTSSQQTLYPINGLGYTIHKTDHLNFYEGILSQTPTEVYSLDPRHHTTSGIPLGSTHHNADSWYPYRGAIDNTVRNSSDHQHQRIATKDPHIILSERTTVV